MLPEAGATELIFLAAVALIVVGPKDLPVLMRKVGQWVAKMRALAAEFRSSFDELARQSELDELRKEVEALRHERISPLADVQPTLDEIRQGLDPHAFSIAGDTTYPPPEFAEPLSPPALEPPAEAPAPAKPRLARKPRADAAAGPAPIAPKPKRKPAAKSADAALAPAKPRPRRGSASAGAKG